MTKKKTDNMNRWTHDMPNSNFHFITFSRIHCLLPLILASFRQLQYDILVFLHFSRYNWIKIVSFVYFLIIKIRYRFHFVFICFVSVYFPYGVLKILNYLFASLFELTALSMSILQKDTYPHIGRYRWWNNTLCRLINMDGFTLNLIVYLLHCFVAAIHSKALSIFDRALGSHFGNLLKSSVDWYHWKLNGFISVCFNYFELALNLGLINRLFHRYPRHFSFFLLVQNKAGRFYLNMMKLKYLN